MKNASAIFCSDLHLRDNIPECRTDDFMKVQANKYQFLRELQKEHNNAPILVAGDWWNHWKPSPFMLAWALRNLPDNMFGIAGQHDLPNHNLENIEKSGLQVLVDSGKVTLLTGEPTQYSAPYSNDTIRMYGYSWHVPFSDIKVKKGNVANIALIHHLVYQGKPPFPGAENVGGTGKAILKAMPGFDLILSGDNHQTFVERYGDSILVNPGSFMRTTASQINHIPKVFLWDAIENEVEAVELPIKQNVISRNHIEIIEERDERLEAFVSKLIPLNGVDKGRDNAISFEDNMREYIAKNKIEKSVESIIKEAMGI